MTAALTLLIAVIAIALVFEYINGFHDSANAIAMVVSTKALSPKHAIMYAAVLNFIGAFFGTHVAQTIGSGLVSHDSITQLVILCSLLGAVIWNLFTWLLGFPSSSSHALIGGLMGAAIAHKYCLLDEKYDLILRLPACSLEHPSLEVLNLHNIWYKILLPMFTSPVLGFFGGLIIIIILLNIFYKMRPESLNKLFRKLQLISSGFLAFSHGSNDAQKTMGIITLSLMTYGFIKGNADFHIPVWVIIICALVMSMGTMSGGWKIIRTMSHKVVKMKPIHGFSAEMAASSIILTASHFGFPVSTTHIISTAIIGVGAAVKSSSVNWQIVKGILTAWIFTIPVCMFLSAVIYLILMNTPLHSVA